MNNRPAPGVLDPSLATEHKVMNCILSLIVPIRLHVQSVMAEAYHLEASNFSLYVWNNAGVFQPTNQNHGIFFAQIWNQCIKVSLSLKNGGLCRERVCKTAKERLFQP